jgi:hypothetical protein
VRSWGRVSLGLALVLPDSRAGNVALRDTRQAIFSDGEGGEESTHLVIHVHRIAEHTCNLLSEQCSVTATQPRRRGARGFFGHPQFGGDAGVRGASAVAKQCRSKGK